jgi:MHS family proline/betaine transporter-like MFS transporter
MRKADRPPSLASSSSSSSSSLPPALSSLDEEVGSAAAWRESGAARRGGADDDCTEASSSCATASSPSTSTKTTSGAGAYYSQQPQKADERPETGHGHGLPTTVASLAGSVLEWYDFAVYGYFSDVLGQVFFPPSASRATSTVEAYVVFGAAFLARPVGAAVAGHVADASSRRMALAGSTLLMAASTLMLGALPSYARAGSAAYALLVVARLLQGLSAGGNLCTSLVFATENHPPHLRGFYAGVLLSSTFVGLLLGSAVSALLRAALSPGQLVAWGWRLPFLAGFAAAGSAWYLRGRGTDAHERLLKEGRERAAAAAEARSASGRALALPLADSPALEAPRTVPAGLGEQPPASPLRATFARANARALAGALLLSAVSAFGLYFTFVWLAAYMSELSPVVLPGAYAINTVHVVLATFVELPLAGFLSDKYGRRRAMTAGAVGVAVLAPLVMGWVSRGDPGAALASLVALGSFYSLYVSALFAWLVDSFEPAIRSTASGAVYNTAQALVGGFAPTVATLLVASSSSSPPSSSPAPPRGPGYVVSGLAGLALAGLWLVAPRRPRCPAEDEPGYRPPRWSDLLPPCRRRRRPAGRAVRPAEEQEPQQQER